MPTGNQFDTQSAQRIAVVVQTVEARQRSRLGRRGRTPIADDDDGFQAQITGYSSVGASGSGGAQSNQWVYTFVQVQPVSGGVGQPLIWQNTPGGISGSTAYNTVEANNSPTGIQGNSITISDLGPGQNILPVQGNPVVWMRPAVTCNSSGSGGGSGSGSGGGVNIFLFEYVNSTGPCTGSGS